MNFIVAALLLVQVASTPIAAGGSLVLSEAEPQFPDLPLDIEPQPITENLELLYVNVIPGSSGYQVRGEVRNISTSPLTGVTLVFTLSDGTQFDGPTDVEYIPPGARAPFSISAYGDDLVASLNQSQEFASVSTCGFERVAPLRQHAWSYADVEVEFDPSHRAVRVSGSATNTEGTPPEWAAPMVFGFSENGQYAGAMYPVGEMTKFTPSGGLLKFELDRGFGTYSSDEPFSNAGIDPTFVLAVVQPTTVSLSCA